MRAIWSDKAQLDLGRLHAFLAVHNVVAADRAVAALLSAPDQLLQFPRMGQRVETMSTHEIRRLIVAKYEMRYEVHRDTIVILRIFHSREDR
jgi:plasmid stabilization system protein ParE